MLNSALLLQAQGRETLLSNQSVVEMVFLIGGKAI